MFPTSMNYFNLFQYFSSVTLSEIRDYLYVKTQFFEGTNKTVIDCVLVSERVFKDQLLK